MQMEMETDWRRRAVVMTVAVAFEEVAFSAASCAAIR